MKERKYIAIDLKSFYASVECVERGLDPLTTNLVVADSSRTQKTICLAVSPSLKKYGISGRARLFEVEEKVKLVNAQRLYRVKGKRFSGESFKDIELKNNPSLKLLYIIAPPRMAHYIEWSTKVYSIYLKYISPDDIHVYSIDEVIMDVTDYLKTYKMTAKELAMTIIKDVLKNTGITATAGIGTNMYLAKIAMDIEAKHTEADENGVRIAELDEMSYRKKLWTHTPITDFWRVGRGYANKLSSVGIYNMGDVARCSIGKKNDFHNEDLLYKLFGVNAELLIDHAWGYEPCTIADVKAYKPEKRSRGIGQVLQNPYTYEQAKIVVREMTESLVLELFDKRLVTKQIVLTVGYDIDNLKNKDIIQNYKGDMETDRYGRKVPKSAHGTANTGDYTSSTKTIVDVVMKLYDEIIDKNLLIRRINISANDVITESSVVHETENEQMNFFTDYEKEERDRLKMKAELKKERDMQQAMLDIKKKFGKNSVLKGTNLQEYATEKDRNGRIGGHKA